MDCCERGFILIEIDGTLETKFYLVRYPVCLLIKTCPWYVAFLVYSRWPPSRSALIYGSTIKKLNFHETPRLLICLLSGHWPEETRVRWHWDMWWAKPQVNSRDQTIVVSEVGLLSEIAGTLLKKSYIVRY